MRIFNIYYVLQQEEKPFNMNNYNPWLNRANELLDLTSQQQECYCLFLTSGYAP